MVRRMLALAALAAASSVPAAPAHAEFFSFEQLRSMCRGEGADDAEFRTGAAHELLREIYRSRCRMYLLGEADFYLEGSAQEGGRPSCLPAGTPQSEVGDYLVEAVLTRTEAPPGGVRELVRHVLRLQYNCT